MTEHYGIPESGLRLPMFIILGLRYYVYNSFFPLIIIIYNGAIMKNSVLGKDANRLYL